MAMGQRRVKADGATKTAAMDRSQLQWGRSSRGNCKARGMGQRGNGDGARGLGQLQWQCNSNGNGVETSKRGNGDGAMATARSIDCNGNGARGLGHWGNSDSECNGKGAKRSIVFLSKRNVYVVLQRKTSTIVVDENVQNMWTAIISDVLRSNKTCMFCSGILFGVSYLYSKVEF
jgi:hypothetical protein